MSTLIAGDLMLLLLDDESGKIAESTNLDALLGGALLTELALSGAVRVNEPTGLLRRRKVAVVDGTPAPTDPLLADALATVAAKERTAEELVTRLGKGTRDVLLDRLAAAGTVRVEEDRLLGVFPRKRWPALRTSRAEELERRVSEVLLDGAEPDRTTAATIALLHAVDRAHQVIDRRNHPARDVRRRAEEVAQGDWAAGAVRDAVQAAQTAVAAAVVVAGTAAYAGS